MNVDENIQIILKHDTKDPVEVQFFPISVICCHHNLLSDSWDQASETQTPQSASDTSLTRTFFLHL